MSDAGVDRPLLEETPTVVIKTSCLGLSFFNLTMLETVTAIFHFGS